VQSGITLAVNQNAVVDATLKAGGVQEVVTVTENASLLNTTTSEVSTRFDAKRLSELPISSNRNVYNVLLSVRLDFNRSFNRYRRKPFRCALPGVASFRY
jgi:dihydroxyacid dehydratase/phosphogluconate dehydratase